MATELRLITGEPGSGKSYQVVRWLVEEILPYYEDLKVLTNVPLVLPSSWQSRVTMEEFAEGWLPPGEDQDQMLEYLRNTVVIMDEFHRTASKNNVKTIVSLIGLARKRDTQWVVMSQSKKSMPDEFDDLAGVWIECLKTDDLRDPVFGIRVADMQNLKAKLTGKFVQFFQRTEYTKLNRRWCPISKVPHQEYFRQEIGDCYDTKNGGSNGDDGRAKVTHDYQRFGLGRLLVIIARRNAHVIPGLLFRNGSMVAMVVVGVGWTAYSYGFSNLFAKPRTPVVTNEQRVKVEQKAVAAAAPPAAPAAAARVAVRRKVITWVLLLCALVGCRTPGAPISEGPEVGHIARRLPGADPRVAAFGDGHSLDGLLSDAGIKSSTGLQVDGPLVGREVLDVARGAGYSLKGDTLVPARKRAVAVPQELGKVEGAADVGGFPVKLVNEDEVDQWRDMSSVVHEAYRTELLIVAVSSSTTRELSAIVSGQGTLTVSQPVSTNPFSGKLGVALAMNGTVITGREIARPVLTSAPGGSANVHVGSRIPVRLASSTVSNQTTTTVGSTIQYIQTGTQVTVRPTRVSATQVRLAGEVTISAQTATVDSVPVTSERALSIDHLLILDAWTVLGRLDSAAVKTSRGWISLGNFRSESDDTFVVVGRVLQVHKDERTHDLRSVVDRQAGPETSAGSLEAGPKLVETLDPPKADGPKVALEHHKIAQEPGKLDGLKEALPKLGMGSEAKPGTATANSGKPGQATSSNSK